MGSSWAPSFHQVCSFSLILEPKPNKRTRSPSSGTAASHSLHVNLERTGGEKANDTSVFVFLCFQFVSRIRARPAADVPVSNITLFHGIMMPQRCLCSHTAQLGQHKPAECEQLFNGNQSPPQISSLVPGERLSGESTPPTANQRSLRLEKHNCHC